MSLRVISAALTVGIGLVGLGVGATPTVATDPIATVQLAIAVPITVPEGSGGLIDAEALALYTSPLGTLTRQLDAVQGRPVTLGVDPRIIVSIRILGSNAPPSATAWLSRLSGLSNESFALSYADSDITLATQAGSPEILAPVGFDFAIDPALFTEPAPLVTATSSPAPTSTPPSSATAPPVAPVVPPLPTGADLVDWPFSLANIAWPVKSTVIAADLPVIAGSGLGTTILSSANVARAADAGARIDVADTAALVSDDAVSVALRSAVRSFTPSELQINLTAFSASVAAAALPQAGPTATVFATLDRNALEGGNRFADAIAAAQADPNIELVNVSDLLADAPTDATIVDSPQDADRVALTRQLLDAHTADTQFAEIAADPLAITAARRLDLLALQSAGWITNPTGWPVVVAQDLAASTALRASVQVASTGDFNFLAAAAPLPIAVANTLDQAITVYVTVRPDTGLLSVGNPRVELEIGPNSQSSAMIPAQAVSNGVVGVTVSLSTSSGLPIGDASRARINVQAGWETPIVVIIAVLLVAVFGGGLVRNILRLRRAAAARGTTA